MFSLLLNADLCLLPIFIRFLSFAYKFFICHYILRMYIELQLIYNIILASGVQYRDSTVLYYSSTLTGINCSCHLQPCNTIKILLTIFPMLDFPPITYMTYNWKCVPLNLFTYFTHPPIYLPLTTISLFFIFRIVLFLDSTSK